MAHPVRNTLAGPSPFLPQQKGCRKLLGLVGGAEDPRPHETSGAVRLDPADLSPEQELCYDLS